MRFEDRWDFAWGTLRRQGFKSLLTVLGVVIGLASVIVLTGLGDGVRAHVEGQFTQFGTGLIIMTPGKTEVMGIPGNLGGTYKDITFDDCRRIAHLPGIVAISPMVGGTVNAEFGGLSRRIQVYGVTGAGRDVWDVDLVQGRYIQSNAYGEGAAEVVLGETVVRELFGTTPPLGKRLRLGDVSFTVVGVLARKGSILGIDINDSVTIPAGRAFRLFNKASIQEVNIKVRDLDSLEVIKERVADLMLDRHGEEDVTLISQEELLDSLGSIMEILQVSVVAIAGISLFVGAVGILTMMWIGVQDRRQEIGLIKALGATDASLRFQFLLEASLLSALGGIVGVVGGHLFLWVVEYFIPALPTQPNPWVTLLSLSVAVVVGLAAGWVPAAHASALPPAQALREQ